MSCIKQWLDTSWETRNSLQENELFVLDRRWESFGYSSGVVVDGDLGNAKVPISLSGATNLTVQACIKNTSSCDNFIVEMWNTEGGWKHYWLEVVAPFFRIKNFEKDVTMDVALDPTAYGKPDEHELVYSSKMYDMTVRHFNLPMFAERNDFYISKIKLNTGMIKLHKCRYKLTMFLKIVSH